ncbi:unnamed protein product, partial [Prorocentrum cordatum]
MEWTLWHLDNESHRQQKMLYVIKVLDLNGMGSDGRKVPIFVPKMKEFLIGMMQSMQHPYCEHDACFIMLNAPFVFRLVWGVFSLMMTAKQKSKVIMLGSTSDKKALDRLLQLVPASMLPQELGGERRGLQNLYPPAPASEIPEWISRMRSIQMWPPSPLPAAVLHPGGPGAGAEGEPGAAVPPPAALAAEAAEGGAEMPASAARAPTDCSTLAVAGDNSRASGRATTASTARAPTDCSTLAVAGDARAATDCSTLAVAGCVGASVSARAGESEAAEAAESLSAWVLQDVLRLNPELARNKAIAAEERRSVSVVSMADSGQAFQKEDMLRSRGLNVQVVSEAGLPCERSRPPQCSTYSELFQKCLRGTAEIMPRGPPPAIIPPSGKSRRLKMQGKEAAERRNPAQHGGTGDLKRIVEKQMDLNHLVSVRRSLMAAPEDPPELERQQSRLSDLVVMVAEKAKGDGLISSMISEAPTRRGSVDA